MSRKKFLFNKRKSVKETNLNTPNRMDGWTDGRMDGWTIFSRQDCISGKQNSEQEERFCKHRQNLIFLTTQY